METTLTLQKNAITETYYDMQNLINKIVWRFYKRYGGDFEDIKAEANFLFIQAYNTHKKQKGRFSTWLYFRTWKGLLDYHKTLYQQIPPTILNEYENNMPLLRAKTNSFSSLELLDGVGNDTITLIHLIWNLPHDLPITSGPHPCHTKAALRNYLFSIGWTGKRIKESFMEITRIINDN